MYFLLFLKNRDKMRVENPTFSGYKDIYKKRIMQYKSGIFMLFRVKG